MLYKTTWSVSLSPLSLLIDICLSWSTTLSPSVSHSHAHFTFICSFIVVTMLASTDSMHLHPSLKLDWVHINRFLYSILFYSILFSSKLYLVYPCFHSDRLRVTCWVNKFTFLPLFSLFALPSITSSYLINVVWVWLCDHSQCKVQFFPHSQRLLRLAACSCAFGNLVI